ncbi:hypothetical protein D3C72_2218780 [compost metagenome]
MQLALAQEALTLRLSIIVQHPSDTTPVFEEVLLQQRQNAQAERLSQPRQILGAHQVRMADEVVPAEQNFDATV